MVLQSSICEKSRFDIKDFKQEKFPYSYPYEILKYDYLENTNNFIITLKWLKYILKYRPNVINLTGYQEIGTLPVLVLSKLMNIKTIMTNESVYSKVLHKASFTSYFKHVYKRIIFFLTDGFFSYGINSNDFLFRHGVVKKKILFFLNSFDKTKFSQNISFDLQHRNKTIVFVGRLSPEKNLNALISLFRFFKTDNLDYKLVLVGDGPLREKVQNDILKYDLNIQITGSVLWNELSDYYRKSICLILPSINETWGMVANEAIQMGVSVICTKACGCANDLVIDNYSGLVVENFDFAKEDLSYSKILNFLENSKVINKKFLKNNALIFDSERLITDSLYHLLSH